MQSLVNVAERAAAHLKRRKETIAVCESSSGGLIAAALLAVPGASAYFAGGMVIYTRQGYDALREFEAAELRGARSSSEENALVRADLARDRFGATWGLGETGAAGPTGNRYGDPAGHTCIGVTGPARASTTLRTGRSERLENMQRFAAAALEQLEAMLAKS
jgi:nicotinamide-nucleotide amidase